MTAKEIKTRLRSLESTKKLTNAMELVASSKLRRAQSRALGVRPYFQTLQQITADIAVQSRPVKMTAYIVIAGDRGLAGGYNSNILKAALADMENKNVMIFPVGKKATVFFNQQSDRVAETMTLEDCFALAKSLWQQFLSGAVDEVMVAYTEYVSALSQAPRIIQLLPMRPSNTEKTGKDILYEPDRESVLEALIPDYMGGVLYSALCESRAAEQAARRTAMDSATRNADELIADLRLRLNRTRQAAITGELIDMIAGS